MYLRPSRFETETARVVAEIHSDSLSIFILEASSLSSDCNGELGIERSSLSVDHMDNGGACRSKLSYSQQEEHRQ